MKRILSGLAAALAWTTAAAAQPVGDFHQHLFSPDLAALINVNPITAQDLVAMLDAAGIRRAAVLSVGYSFANPARQVAVPYDKVKAENDWVSRQVAPYRGRLIGFCAVNPLAVWAIEELDRCARDPNLRRGLKLHMGNSVVNLDNPAHVASVRRVFAAANGHRMAIVIHLRASVSQRLPYGTKQAQTFLDEVLPAAPDVPVQIAHLAGAGANTDAFADQAMDVFVEAIRRKDKRVKNLWFDVTAAIVPGIPPARAELAAQRIREVGVKRVLYGSDAAAGGNLRPREAWEAFRKLTPLTEKEFRTIERNVPPYAR